MLVFARRTAMTHKSTWQPTLNQVLPGNPHSVATDPQDTWPVRCCSHGVTQPAVLACRTSPGENGRARSPAGERVPVSE